MTAVPFRSLLGRRRRRVREEATGLDCPSLAKSSRTNHFVFLGGPRNMTEPSNLEGCCRPHERDYLFASETPRPQCIVERRLWPSPCCLTDYTTRLWMLSVSVANTRRPPPQDILYPQILILHGPQILIFHGPWSRRQPRANIRDLERKSIAFRARVLPCRWESLA